MTVLKLSHERELYYGERLGSVAVVGCGTISRVTRWLCPKCDREFASVNHAHVCVPGILLTTSWVDTPGG